MSGSMPTSKPRRGRPPGSTSGRPTATARLSIRVLPGELAQLNRVALVRGQPLAALLRPALVRLMRSIP
jgi:hypothetical protein